MTAGGQTSNLLGNLPIVGPLVANLPLVGGLLHGLLSSDLLTLLASGDDRPVPVLGSPSISGKGIGVARP